MCISVWWQILRIKIHRLALKWIKVSTLFDNSKITSGHTTCCSRRWKEQIEIDLDQYVPTKTIQTLKNIKHFSGGGGIYLFSDFRFRRGKGGDESWNITSEGWLYTESERNTVLTVTTTLWCKYSCNRHTSVNYSFSVKNIKCVYAHESEYIGCQKSLTVDEVVFKFPLKVMKTGPFSVRHVRVLGNGWLMQREGGLRNAGNPCL